MRLIEQILNNKDQITVFRWHCRCDVKIDYEHGSMDLGDDIPDMDDVMYSLIFPDGSVIVATDALGEHGMFTIWLHTVADKKEEEQFECVFGGSCNGTVDCYGFKELLHLFSLYTEEHFAAVTGKRRMAKWTAENGKTAELVSDDLSFLMDCHIIGKEILCPDLEVSWNEDQAEAFWTLSQKVNDYFLYCVEHPRNAVMFDSYSK